MSTIRQLLRSYMAKPSSGLSSNIFFRRFTALAPDSPTFVPTERPTIKLTFVKALAALLAVAACDSNPATVKKCWNPAVLRAAIGNAIVDIPAAANPFPDPRQVDGLISSQDQYGSVKGRSAMAYCQDAAHVPIRLKRVTIKPKSSSSRDSYFAAIHRIHIVDRSQIDTNNIFTKSDLGKVGNIHLGKDPSRGLARIYYGTKFVECVHGIVTSGTSAISCKANVALSRRVVAGIEFSSDLKNIDDIPSLLGRSTAYVQSMKIQPSEGS